MNNSVDKYISAQPYAQQQALKKIREIVYRVEPNATEGIAYGMPAYKLDGKPLIYTGAFSHHIGIYPLPDTIKQFEKEIALYKHAKGSIQFPIEKLPYDLIEKIIKFRKKQIS